MAKRESKIKTLTLTAIFIAIITVMTFVPYTGYIKLGPVEITTLHIPVIIGAVVLGKKGGFLLGTAWGILCVIKAFATGDPIFVNPLISLVPRMIDGFLVGFVADLLRGRVNLKVYSIICGALGSLVNTVLVLGAIALFAADTFILWFGLDPEQSLTVAETLRNILLVVAGTNGVVELVLAIFLTPILTSAINHVYPIHEKNL